MRRETHGIRARQTICADFPCPEQGKSAQCQPATRSARIFPALGRENPRRRGPRVLAALVLSACASGTAADAADLPPMDVAAFQSQLESSGRPAVVNVWASWCLPCRDEAPLFTEAYSEYGDSVDFYGIAYNDNQPGARQFLEEFDLPFTHYFDFDGDALAEFGGIGVPRTYFFDPEGELVITHNGVINSETLTRQIEEVLNR